MSDRDTIRAALVGSTPVANQKVIELFGHKVVFKQPTLGAILRAAEITDEAERSADMVIKYAHTEDGELLFEPGDLPMILEWPFGEDVQQVINTIQELTGVDISSAEGDLETNPLL